MIEGCKNAPTIELKISRISETCDDEDDKLFLLYSKYVCKEHKQEGLAEFNERVKPVQNRL